MKKIIIGTLLLLGTHAFASESQSCLKTALELGTYSGRTADQGACTLTISCHVNSSVADGSPIPVYDFSVTSEALSKLSSTLQEGSSNVVSAVDEDITSEHLITWASIDGFAVEDSIVDSIQFSGETPVSFTAVTTHKNFLGKNASPHLNTDCRNLTRDRLTFLSGESSASARALFSLLQGAGVQHDGNLKTITLDEKKMIILTCDQNHGECSVINSGFVPTKGADGSSILLKLNGVAATGLFDHILTPVNPEGLKTIELGNSGQFGTDWLTCRKTDKESDCEVATSYCDTPGC